MRTERCKQTKAPTAKAASNGRPGPLARQALPRYRLRLRRVLVPIDFSLGCKHALASALPLARRLGARLLLLHVVEPLRDTVNCGYGDVMREWPDERRMRRLHGRLRRMASQLGCSRPKIETRVRSGKAWKEIVECAQAEPAELIVLHTRGLTPATAGLPGSITEAVARSAPCPVLILRHHQHNLVA